MPIFLAILSALSALAGPASEMLKSLFNLMHVWHQGSDTTPDQLATEAATLFKDAAAFTSDLDTQITMVSQALRDRHSDLDPAHAHVVAAAATKAS